MVRASLQKTLEPKESDRGRLEIAPRQFIIPSTSQSFIREEAPYPTRVPALLLVWNKRRHSLAPLRFKSADTPNGQSKF